ncbi:MAG: acyltransferase [Zoogloeaceae bacterium]|nr:acyltransferase [Zoogloeaceae bacterium]
MNYRKEIDGLRAIAVTSVILAHAGFSWINGGFIGVDVFFVISGYLITGILLTELQAGNFSFAKFYERRARRILPALFCVLICCLPFAGWLMLPDQLEGFAASLLRVIAFIPNFWFRSQTGYFAPSAEEMPLLHTWSLGVEEQFYLFFPLVLLLLWRWTRRSAREVADERSSPLQENIASGCRGDLWSPVLPNGITGERRSSVSMNRRRVWVITAVILIIALWSLGYADHKSWRYSDKVFFTTTARIWELFFGALAAIYHMHWRKRAPKRWLAESGALFGLACIVLACLYFKTGMRFPGRYALLPTVGALGVILFATPQTLVGRLLASKPLVGIGLISYSAYLWHQPVFAFARLAEQSEFSIPALTSGVFVCLCLLSFVLAYLSWRFVEQPFRNRQFLRRNHIFILSVVGGGIDSIYRAVGGTGRRVARPIFARGA